MAILAWALRNWQGIAFGILIAGTPAYFKGSWDGARGERAAALAAATVNAAKRIAEMEHNNANFRNLQTKEKCRALAVSMSQPESICEGL